MHLARKYRSIVVSGSLLALLVGCGGGTVRKTGMVAGTIKLDGKPLPAMQVLFEDAKNGFRASTVVTDGAYQFESPLVVGTYQVTIQPPPAPPPTAAPQAKAANQLAVPKQYLTAANSGLSADVREGANTFDFALKP